MKKTLGTLSMLFRLTVGVVFLLAMVGVKDISAQRVPTSTIVATDPPQRVNAAALSREPRIFLLSDQVLPRHSDLDPSTLQRLKRQPHVPPALPPYQRIEFPSVVGVRPAPGPRLAVTQANFLGPSQADNFASGFLARPPDPDIAAGPNHVAAVVNSLVTVYNVSGSRLLQVTLPTWFSSVCSGCSTTDPRIAYDPQEGHWIIVALSLNLPGTVGRVLLSVSQTSDPTGTWFNYNLDGSFMLSGVNTFPDFPDLGFDGVLSTGQGDIYITTNQFGFADMLFRGATVFTLPKAQLYSGAAVTGQRWSGFTNTDGSLTATLRAAKTYGNPGVEFLVNSKNTSDVVQLWSFDPTLTAPPTRGAAVTIGAYSVPPDAQQLGCSRLLDTGDNRLYNAIWRNSRIYTAFSEANGVLSNARYLKINTSTNAAELNVSLGSTSASFFYPAVTVDGSENIVVVFAASGSSEFGNVRYVGHRAGDPSPQAPVSLKTGEQCIIDPNPTLSSRWGDYFGAAVEPVGFKRARIFGEWASNLPGIDNVWNWGTAIGRVQFDPKATVGLYSPAAATFYLRNLNTSGVADITPFTFGPAGAGWMSLVGDWDGNGDDTVGLYDPAAATVYLRNSNTTGVADITPFNFGPGGSAGWMPLAGHWTAGSVATIGLYNPATATFYLRNSNTTGQADIVFNFGPGGNAGWIPVAGDWIGQGFTTIGLYDPATATFYLRNSNTTGQADIVFNFGPGGNAGWIPVAGGWIGQGRTTIGLYNPSTATFYLRNSNTSGVADITPFNFGPGGSAGWRPRAGNW